MRVVKNKQTNLSGAEVLIEKAARLGCQLVILPEMFNCPYSLELFSEYAESIPDGPTCTLLAQLASRHHIFLIGGSIPELGEMGRIFNTSTIFDPAGCMLARHRKLHLFDISIPERISFQESAAMSAGEESTIVTTSLAEIGLAICYDLRFPELSRRMTLAGADLLVYPAAFNTVTGPAHWEILLRARAIDNQVYIAAASPAPDPESSYQAYGHSMIIDPWGTVLAEAKDHPSVITALIDPAVITRVRREMPLLKHRRPQLY